MRAERCTRVRPGAREPDRRAHRLQPAASRCRSRSPQGVTVSGRGAAGGRPPASSRRPPTTSASTTASRSATRPPAEGWRAFVRGVGRRAAARRACRSCGARLEIAGDVPRGAGLSSSAALEVALCLALLELGRERAAASGLDRLALARLCARVENDWVGRTRACSTSSRASSASPTRRCCIDFRTLEVEPVPLALGRLAPRGRSTRASATRTRARATTSAAPSARGRASCSASRSLREATPSELARAARAAARPGRHVLEENERVLEAVAALRARDARRWARCSTPRTRACATSTRSPRPRSRRRSRGCCGAGAARRALIGGGFGGCVLGAVRPRRAAARAARARCARAPARTCSPAERAAAHSRRPASAAAVQRRPPATSPRAHRRAARAAPAATAPRGCRRRSVRAPLDAQRCAGAARAPAC